MVITDQMRLVVSGAELTVYSAIWSVFPASHFCIDPVRYLLEHLVVVAAVAVRDGAVAEERMRRVLKGEERLQIPSLELLYEHRISLLPSTLRKTCRSSTPVQRLGKP